MDDVRSNEQWKIENKNFSFIDEIIVTMLIVCRGVLHFFDFLFFIIYLPRAKKIVVRRSMTITSVSEIARTVKKKKEKKTVFQYRYFR